MRLAGRQQGVHSKYKLQDITVNLFVVQARGAIEQPMKKSIVTRLLSLVAATGLLAVPAEAQWVKREKVNSRVTVNFGDCPGCNFTGKDLHGLRIKQSNLTGSLFNRANLSGGKILISDLSGAHFKRAFLARVEGDGVLLQGANMADATITESVIRNSYFNGATLTGADLARGVFTNSDFQKANLSNASALATDFSDSNFVKVKFDGANLTGASLRNVKLSDSTFGTAILHGTDLSGASLQGAKLSRVEGLQQAQLDLACGDHRTELPIGLSIPYCAGTGDLLMDIHAAEHPQLKARDNEIAMRVDRAISNTEILMQEANPAAKRELQKIHADLMAVRRKIED